MGLNELTKIIHESARAKGFWDDYDTSTLKNSMYFVAAKLLLISSEVNEAAEELRKKGSRMISTEFKSELADILIRTLDLAGGLEINIENAVNKKLETNQDRPHKHNKRF